MIEITHIYSEALFDNLVNCPSSGEITMALNIVLSSSGKGWMAKCLNNGNYLWLQFTSAVCTNQMCLGDQ